MIKANKITCIGLGSGGHARVLLEVLLASQQYHVIGMLDTNTKLYGSFCYDIPVLGGDELLQNLVRDKNISHFFIGLGSVGYAKPRVKLYEHASRLGLQPMTIVHPTAFIAPTAVVGNGVQVLAHAVVNTEAHMGHNVIINTNAIIEHDCLIGDHSHIATGAKLAGSVTVGQQAHVGIGAVIREGIVVGDNAVIGAGAVVVKDVPANVTVVGNPAAILKRTANAH